MKELKKLLSDQAPSVLPDDRIRENIRRELGYAQAPEREAAYAHGGSAALGGKKTWIALGAALLAAALLLGILLPVFLRADPLPGGGKFLQIKDTDDFYAYGAASVGSILSSRDASNAAAAAGDTAVLRRATALRSVSAPAAQTDSLLAAAARADRSLTEQQAQIADTVNGYMSLVEELLSDGAIEHETTAAEGEFAAYTYHTAVYHTDLLGNRIRSDLYYDMTMLGSHTDGDEKEEYYAIDGVLVPENGIAYPMTGRREAESEEDESESETQFTAYLNEERTAYIRMEQESEQEDDDAEIEQKYVYIYNDGTSRHWTERTVVEYEQEEGELELKMTIEQQDGRRDEIVFSNEDSRGDTLYAEADIDGTRVYFTVTIFDDNGNTGYRYDFGGGHTGDHDRFDDDDDDDDDDDGYDDDDDDDDDDRPHRPRQG